MSSVNEILMDGFVTYTANLRRMTTTETVRILGLLEVLKEEVVNKLYDNPKLTDFKRTRLEALLKQINEQVQDTYVNITDTNLETNANVARLTARQMERSFSSLSIPLLSVITTDEQYKALASNALIQGAPSKDWWNRQSTQLQDAFSQQVRLGYMAGESIDDIVRRVRGTATGNRNTYEINGKQRTFVEFEGGIMDTGTRQARTLVRTSVQQVSNDARMEMFRSNSDLIKELQWVATLDKRTSLICAARGGRRYSLEGKPIGHDIPFIGGPPAHFNCRSVIIPILYSWEELTGDKSLDDMYTKIPQGTRASMDGQVPAHLTFEQWFNTKDVDFQRDYLGATRYRMKEQNRLKLQDFVDFDGMPLTIRQLEQKYAK